MVLSRTALGGRRGKGQAGAQQETQVSFKKNSCHFEKTGQRDRRNRREEGCRGIQLVRHGLELQKLQQERIDGYVESVLGVREDGAVAHSPAGRERQGHAGAHQLTRVWVNPNPRGKQRRNRRHHFVHDMHVLLRTALGAAGGKGQAWPQQEHWSGATDGWGVSQSMCLIHCCECHCRPKLAVESQFM
jgi:hypothetical protein